MNLNATCHSTASILYTDNMGLKEILSEYYEKKTGTVISSDCNQDIPDFPVILLIDVEYPSCENLFNVTREQPDKYFRIAVIQKECRVPTDGNWTESYDSVLFVPCSKSRFDNAIEQAASCLNRCSLPEFSSSHIIQHIQQIVIIIDTSGIVLFVNRFFEDLSGWTAKEIVGKKSYDFFIDKKIDRRFYSVYIKKLLRKNAFPEQFELSLKMKNGDTKLFLWSSVLIPDSQGRIFSLAGIAMDITEKREMNKALAKSEQRFRMLADTIDDVFFMVDLKKHKTLYVNSKFEKLWGFPPIDLDSDTKNFMKTIHPDDRELFSRTMHSVRENPKPFEIDFRIIKRDGRIKWLRERGYPILSWNSKRPLLVGIETDITRLKEHEEVLNENLKEKEMMLKEIHHRVKNNLNIINSLLSLQSGTIHSVEDAKHAFIKTTNRVRSMALVHEQMYKQSSITSVNMYDIIRNIIRINRGSLNFQGLVKSKIHIDAVKLSLDQVVPLSLIFNEMASNSFLYAFPEEFEGLLNVSLMQKGSYVEFIASDNGPGSVTAETLHNKGSLGFMLINELTAQLRGSLKIKNENGLKYQLVFPSS